MAYLLKIRISCGVCEYLVAFLFIFRMHSKWFRGKSEYPANILWHIYLKFEYPVEFLNILWPICWKFKYPVEFVNIRWPFWLSLDCILSDSKLNLNILPISCGLSIENSNILWSSLPRIADKRLLKSGYYSILSSAGNPPEMKCTPSDIEPYRIAKSWSRIGQFSLNRHAHWLKMWTLIPGAASEAGPGLCLWCGDWLSAK